ncbi:hypothetical protein GCM10010381_43040 [Streptomyces xantholiticus]|nr:hypothetical protein GCM10010381_43040 [Streptomyces xantholiticus]
MGMVAVGLWRLTWARAVCSHPALSGVSRAYFGELLQELAPKCGRPPVSRCCDASGGAKTRTGSRCRDQRLAFVDRLLVTLVRLRLGCRTLRQLSCEASTAPPSPARSARSARCRRADRVHRIEPTGGTDECGRAVNGKRSSTTHRRRIRTPPTLLHVLGSPSPCSDPAPQRMDTSVGPFSRGAKARIP